ncbi:DUF2608 domain-containing protein [Candidatus Babeliales bacterium]|nr:DUF2608 domain-containing protein [Candidatus Babeliales bacterium]
MKKIIALTLGIAAIAATAYFGSHYFSPTQEEPAIFPQVYSVNQVKDELAQANSSTFVFFDCDDTLITADDYLPRTFYLPLSLRLLMLLKHPSLLFKKGEGERLYSLMLEQAPRKLVEPEVVNVIKNLHAQDAHVLGITGMETGRFGIFENLPAWRADMLKDFGVVLCNEFENVTFDNLPLYRNNYPALHNGLICCNQIPKGTLIGAFLDHFKLKPSTIILFDDTHDELVSLQEECAKRNIKAVCYHYKAVSRLYNQQFNLWHTLKQIDHLIEHSSWLPDAAPQPAH